MKKIFFIIAALCCMMVAKAQTQPDNEIWYTSSDNSVEKCWKSSLQRLQWLNDIDFCGRLAAGNDWRKSLRWRGHFRRTDTCRFAEKHWTSCLRRLPTDQGLYEFGGFVQYLEQNFY